MSTIEILKKYIFVLLNKIYAKYSVQWTYILSLRQFAFSNPGFVYPFGCSMKYCSMVEQETSINSDGVLCTLSMSQFCTLVVMKHDCLLPMGIKFTLSGNEDPFVDDLVIKNVLCGFLCSIIFHSIVTEWGGHNSQSNRAGQHTQYGHAKSSTIL